MDMIDTMPQLRKAHVNDIEGLGYAEVIATTSEHICRGVVVFDQDTDLRIIKNHHPENKAVFEGVLYRSGGEVFETLMIDILYTSFDEDADPGLTFKGKLARKSI